MLSRFRGMDRQRDGQPERWKTYHGVDDDDDYDYVGK